MTQASAPQKVIRTAGDSSTVYAMQRDSVQIALLRQEVALLREWRGDSTNSVNTSLGVVVALAIVLVGYNWFSSGRSYQRDKAALSKELEGDILERVGTLKQELSLEIQARADEITRKAGNDVAEATRDAIQDTRQKLAAALSDMRGVRSALGDLEMASLSTEARYWELKGVPANALSRWIRILDATVRLQKYGVETSEALTNMLRLAQDGVLPGWPYVSEVVKSLDALPSEYQTEVALMKQKLTEVKRA